MSDLLIIVPTRSRPEAVPRVVEAWRETGAFDDGAELLFVVDADDPTIVGYGTAIVAARQQCGPIYRRTMPEWKPLVPKLNMVAEIYARAREECFAIGFAGDDHLPRTRGWARRYVEALRELRTGIVFCDDGYQGANLPTQWAMTADIIRALGAMVPAPVEHLYCDNAVGELGLHAGAFTYLPDVLIEHMHPVAGKSETDEQYERVNGQEQYRKDRAAYRQWKRSGRMLADATIVRKLREGTA